MTVFNNLPTRIKAFVRGLGHTSLGTGFASTTDLLSMLAVKIFEPDLSFKLKPFGYLAEGSGIATGYNIYTENKPGALASLVGLIGAAAPYVIQWLQDGNSNYLLIELGKNGWSYSLGAIIGYWIGWKISKKY